MHAEPGVWRFLVSKGPFTPPEDTILPNEPATTSGSEAPLQQVKLKNKRKKPQMAITQEVVAPHIPASLPEPADAPTIEPLSVMSLGSWPRPRWMLDASISI